jgi:hypothetical protein
MNWGFSRAEHGCFVVGNGCTTFLVVPKVEAATNLPPSVPAARAIVGVGGVVHEGKLFQSVNLPALDDDWRNILVHCDRTTAERKRKGVKGLSQRYGKLKDQK